MIVVVPAFIVDTTPVEASTVATAVLLLLQVPPVLPLLAKVVVVREQSGDVPVTVPAFAFGLTVNDCNAVTGLLHPVLTV